MPQSRMTILAGRRGFALMVTLVVLIVLSSVIVRFQSDMTLKMRAIRYRVDTERCRYGAESGIVLGLMMVAKAMNDSREFYTAVNQGQDYQSLDLEYQGWSTFFDPNATWEENLLSSAVVAQEYETEIGSVDVRIQVHDENAKLPLLWIMSSPYQRLGGRQMTEKPFELYGELLNVDPEQVEQTVALAQRLGNRIQLPSTEVVLQKDSERVTQRRHLGLKKKMDEMKQRRLAMGTFAGVWKSELQHNLDNAFLNEPLVEGKGSFADQLGIWGSNAININTASEEVLYSAFEPLGLTKELAQAIVVQRAETPLRNISSLRDIEGMPYEVYRYMRELCVSYSTSYSIHVTARAGTVVRRMVCGIYRTESGELLNIGIVSQ